MITHLDAYRFLAILINMIMSTQNTLHCSMNWKKLHKKALVFMLISVNITNDKKNEQKLDEGR